MIALLITLADFPDYTPFSVNIGAHLVNPHIRSAQAFDVWPLLPAALRAELQAAFGEATLAGSEGEFYGGEFYTPTPSNLAAMPPIFREYVRPLLVLESARRMLLWHGAHVTPNGLESFSDGSNQAVSGAQRNELRQDLIAQASHYRARLEGALRTAYPSAYSTTCGPARRRSSGGATISAI